MNLTRIAISRPITMVMILGFLVLSGLLGFTRLPVRQLPHINFPFMRVVIAEPGQSAVTIAHDITLRVENALSNQHGLVSMVGTSYPGRSVVALQFVGNTDIDRQASSVALALDKLARALPPDATPAAIIKANPNALPMMNIALYGSLAPSQLYQLASTTVAPDLQEIAGVAQVAVVGGRAPVINVQFHSAALSAYGVSLNQATAAMHAQNTAVSGGVLIVGNQALAAQTGSGYPSVQSLANLPVAEKPGGTVLIKNVATVTQGLARPESYSQLDGHPAVGLVIIASSTANTLSVAHAIAATLHQLDATFPPGVHAAITGNVTDYTQNALRNVESDLIMGILMAGLVLLIFLRRWVNTAIVMLAIPISLISTFAVMDFLGFSLDLISFLALSLVIGILVDDSIVVLENIHRHRLMGKDPASAAYAGRMEIGAAAVAITLTDVVVYAPIAFLSGNIAQLFREFGLTIVAATLFSLLVSFTLTPMLAARWTGREDGGVPAAQPTRSAMFDRARGQYRATIAWALRHRKWVAGVAAVAAVISAAIVETGVIPTTFVPREDIGVYTVNLNLPPGTPLNQSSRIFQSIAATVERWPGVSRVFLSSGYGAGNGTAADIGQMTVDLKARQTRPPIFQYVRRTDRLARQYPGLIVRGHVQNPLVLGGTRAVTVTLLGPDLSTLDTMATRIANRVASDPTVRQVSTSIPPTAPAVTLTVNQAQAAFWGITTHAIGQTLAAALGNVTVPPVVPSPTEPAIPVHVFVGSNGMPSLAQIESLPVAAVHATTVPLGSVATLQKQTASRILQQINREYAVSVSASSSGGNVGPATAALLHAATQVGLPSGYSLQLGGQAGQQKRDFGPLLQAFALSILFVYMLLAALYESFADPMAVLLSIPLATVGALLGLWVTGLAISIFALIAMIMLMGVVTKNAILVVDYAKTLRKQGLSRDDALIEAGTTRLRPILMTTATMVGSMLPLALSHGSGASERMPIAVVLIGGLTSSTLLTLLVVPVLYSYVDDFAQWFSRVPRRLPGPPPRQNANVPDPPSG